ncbi:hypothetical protein EYR36_008121 [Pleurotus pulmonarius]|nr:hypothetical protein EYR36_008121 [Pleurotus pulmonarius]
MKQYPSSNSGIQTGDNWSYNIDYTSTMPMFNNGGNGAFDFEASYKEDFVLSRLKQTGAVVANGVEFATIDPQDVSPFELSILRILTSVAAEPRY